MSEPFFSGGRQAALSLTFDDARLSQIDCGMPILNRHGVRATFYVSPDGVEKRLAAWRSAISAGHEIGSHTKSHPCSGNFAWARSNALEDYTLPRIEQDILACNDYVQHTLGQTPQTFAYPCGQTFVGKGKNHQSYVPIIAKHFVAGRWAYSECAAHPPICDLALLPAREFDCATFAHMVKLVELAIKDGSWLILFGHGVGGQAPQTVPQDALEQLCEYTKTRQNELWTAPVVEVARYLQEKRKESAPC